MEKDYLTRPNSRRIIGQMSVTLALLLTSFLFSVNSYAQDADGDGILDVDELNCPSVVIDAPIYPDPPSIDIILAPVTVSYGDFDITYTQSGTRGANDFSDIPGLVGIEPFPGNIMTYDFSTNVSNLAFLIGDVDSGELIHMNVWDGDGNRIADLTPYITANITSQNPLLRTISVTGSHGLVLSEGNNQTFGGSLDEYIELIFTTIAISKIEIELKRPPVIDDFSTPVYYIRSACESPDTDEDLIPDFLDLDSDNDGILDSVEGNGDTDNDGVPDRLDTDSDNDGCPDAIEAAGAFTSADLDVDGRLLGGVDAITGIPVVAGAGQTTTLDVTTVGPDADGDGIADACDAAFNDVDNDGVADAFDLDNDNDGILDADECAALWTDWGPEDSTAGDNNIINGVIDGMNITLTNDSNIRNPFVLNNNVDGFGGSQGMDVTATDFSSNLNLNMADSNAATYTFTFGAPTTKDLLVHFTAFDKLSVTLTNATIITLVNGSGIGTNVFTKDIGVPANGAGFTAVIPAGTNVFSFQGPAGGDNYMMSITSSCADTDSDGTPDYLDTDSDNDGCADAIEAAGTFTSADLTADNNLANTPAGVDANGVPTNAGSPQATTADVTTVGPDADGDGISDACDAVFNDNDNDGVADAFDLDDDNDGILDSTEQNCGSGTTIDDFNAPIWNYGTGNGGDASGSGTLNGVNFTMAFNANTGTKLFTSTGQFTSNSTLGHGGNPGSLLLGGNGESITFTFDSPMSVVIGFDHLNSLEDGWQFSTPANGVVSLGGGHRAEGISTAVSGVKFIDGFPSPSTTNTSLFKWDNITTLTITTTGIPGTTIGLNSIVSFCDTDGDGIPNYLDLDSDNDGISDVIEAGGIDDDGDGIIDGFTDANNDGLDDVTAATPLPIPNTDGTGNPDYIDIDADDDGIVDNIEAQTTADYLAPSGVDTDNDGLDDNYDGDNGNTIGVIDALGPNGDITPTNTDGTDEPDYLDLDSDNDGDLDSLEGWDTNNDGTPNTVPANADADGDGLDNAYDTDDSVLDPTNGGTFPIDFPDFDTPGGDRDWRQALDNDWDNDGVADAADLDTDNDGIPDTDESGGNEPYGDADGDGIPNWLDTNDDVGAGDGSPTDYTDNDGNGIPDVYDADGDGVPNHLDLDSDNDGIYDIVESGQNVIDLNNDGIIDAANTGTVGTNGLYNPLEDDGLDSGVLATPTLHSDADGTPDSNDINSDGDGCSDVLEAGFEDGDAIPNGLLGTGVFGAGLTVDINGVVNTAGLTTGYTEPNDLDGGTYDYREFGEAVTIAVAPQDQTVILNANANFDLTLGTGVNPTYQWFESTNGVDFFPITNGGIYTGANTATLTINANTVTLDGNMYYVEISAPGYACDGSVTSLPVTLSVVTDFDGDGIPDDIDLDDDNDGIPDAIEGTGDLDGDGIPNHHDLDADGDGVFDTNEAGFADLDLDNDGIIDGDNVSFGTNGLFDGVETAPDSGVINYILLNTDSDANPNFLDVDDDGDGVNTEFENPSSDGNGDPSDAQHSDTDGIPDYLDVDDDGDGVNTEFEVSNADGDGDPNTGVAILNTDGDLLPNYLDTDDDGDGVDTIFENPNPDGDGNPNTGDTQNTDSATGDLIPDYLDTDDDGDSILTIFENPNPDGDGNPNTGNTQDSDNDLIFDYLDVDDDNDGVHTIFENPDPNGDGNPNDAQNTDNTDNPDYLDIDDDNDGINTEDENPDPNGDGNPSDAQDFDNDGTPDYLDIDDDNDGISNVDEDLDGDGDPRNDDSDGDGNPNYLDIDDDGDGIKTIDEGPGNSDDDAFPNYLDQDSDNDGIPDNVEGQPTTGYVNPLGEDTDGNGLDDAYEVVPGSAEGISPVNSDSDSDPDYLDTDSDNDTVPDSTEGHDYDADGQPDVLPSGTDSDNDGLDDAYDGSVGDFFDPNGLSVIDSPADDLPNRDTADEVDYRDTDDDNDGIVTADEDGDGDGDPTNDNCDEDAFPDYLDITSCTIIPDGFSPNGDGDNETFIIPALAQYDNFEMEVYDRWGNIVYDYSNNGRDVPLWWDGYSTGTRTISKGKRVPVGTYYYIIRYNEGGIEPLAGWVYINY